MIINVPGDRRAVAAIGDDTEITPAVAPHADRVALRLHGRPCPVELALTDAGIKVLRDALDEAERALKESRARRLFWGSLI